MFKNVFFAMLFATISTVFIISCDTESINNEEDAQDNMTADPIYSETRENIEANGEVEFNGNSDIYFSFTEEKIVEASIKDKTWDLHFNGWNIFTNGGISGSHAGGGIYIKAEKYDDVTVSEVPGMVFTDTYGSVFDKWYIADMVNSFTISTKGLVYLVKTDETVYKVRVDSYYGDVQGAPVSGIYTISLADLSNLDDIKVIEGIDGSAGGSSGEGDAGYFSFKNGMLEMTDNEAKNSTDWDMSFKRYNINLNSGVSGIGNITGYKLGATDFDAVTEADIPSDENFEDDRIRPVIDKWAIIEDEKLLFTDYYYIIRTGDGKHWYKFYPLEVTNPTIQGYDKLRFRFDKLK